MDGKASGPSPLAVISPQFCVGQPSNITVVRKLANFTDFVVTDAAGSELFKARISAFSGRDRHVLFDAAGNPLITFQKKLLSRGMWKAFRGQSTEEKDLIFSVKPQRSNFFPGKKIKLDVFLSSNTEEGSPDFLVECTSFRANSCDIYAGNDLLAQMRKKTKPECFFLGRKIMEVTVNPFVDYAFVVTLVMILERIYMQKAAAASGARMS